MLILFSEKRLRRTVGQIIASCAETACEIVEDFDDKFFFGVPFV